VVKHVCPFCGKRIARAKTHESNFRGMLSMHVKHKHPEHWIQPKVIGRLTPEKRRRFKP
jgi:hypothetical protein